MMLQLCCFLKNRVLEPTKQSESCDVVGKFKG